MNDMNDVQKEIKRSFELISSISVSGDNVEMMAAAKEALRLAYKMSEVKDNGRQDNG